MFESGTIGEEIVYMQKGLWEQLFSLFWFMFSQVGRSCGCWWKNEHDFKNQEGSFGKVA